MSGLSGYTAEQLATIAAGGTVPELDFDPKLSQTSEGVATSAAEQAVQTAAQTAAQELAPAPEETEEERVARVAAEETETRNKWLLYGGIGVGSLALIGGIYFLMK